MQQLLMRSAAQWVIGSEQQIVTHLEIIRKSGVVLRIHSDGVRRCCCCCCCCCCCLGSARCGTGSRWCCRHHSCKQTTDLCVSCCLCFIRIPHIALADATLASCMAFATDHRSAAGMAGLAISRQRASSQGRFWTQHWVPLTNELGLDPFLATMEGKVPILHILAHQIRDG